MKKIFKIIFINILLMVAMISLLEIAAFAMNVYRYKYQLYCAFMAGDKPKDTFAYPPGFNKDKFDVYYRQPNIAENSTKNPILVFGCSFAYGDGLENNETIAGQLSKLTNRTVYNRAEGGMGPQMMLYQLKTGIIKNMVKDCDYVIFVNIADSNRRCVMYRCWPFLPKTGVKYKLSKNNKLILNTLPQIIIKSNLYRYIDDTYSNTIDSNKIFYAILKESYEETKNLYPGSRFIILNYSKEKIEIAPELEYLGIEIINFEDLNIKIDDIFDLKYQLSEYDWHPNKEAWEYIVPKLIKKLNIN